MAMRIWHQSFTVLSDLPAYEQGIAKHAQRVLRPDTELVLHGQLPGTYPGNYPGDDIGYGYTYWIHGNQWIAAALGAERDGFDAYAMCTLPNPMLREARSLVDIPVVGMGEAVFHTATMYGQRFGVMLFIDRMVPLYEEQIRGYGLESRCAGVQRSGLTFHDVLAGFDDPQPAIDRFCESARAMITEKGADVIVPGELPISLLLALNGVSRVDDVPIMDTLAVTLKTAEMMVELKRTTGLSASRHGFMNSVPSRARTDEVLEFYGLNKLSF
ncbi:MAG: allantoin racemase [Gammaproteobacteria bacterium]|jgi:allantoin racemase